MSESAFFGRVESVLMVGVRVCDDLDFSDFSLTSADEVGFAGRGAINFIYASQPLCKTLEESGVSSTFLEEGARDVVRSLLSSRSSLFRFLFPMHQS
jgi:hypothetical protein